MFPMVATINEFRDAKAILLEEKENLKMMVMMSLMTLN